MCVHWLIYVRLNRKDRLKNMSGTTLEVAMIADVSGDLQCDFWCLPMCDWAPLI